MPGELVSGNYRPKTTTLETRKLPNPSLHLLEDHASDELHDKVLWQNGVGKSL